MRFVTIPEFCRSIGISRVTYYRWRRQGKTPTEIRVGMTVRIPELEIEKWASKHVVKASRATRSRSSALPSGRIRRTGTTRSGGSKQ